MVSIIIPVYNEEVQLPKLINHLGQCSDIESTEIIIVDGGSTDKTLLIARELGVEVYESPKKGRAAQMNYGTEVAKNDTLYFLHVDTLPPLNFLEQIRSAQEKNAKAGCFRLGFDHDHWILKCYAWFTRFDLDIFRFGDQSLFVDAALFQKISGFKEELIVMEDQEIVRRIKKEGVIFKIIEDKVTTSARRYLMNGIIRLQLVFSLILVAYYLNINQQSLVSLYNRLIKNG